MVKQSSAGSYLWGRYERVQGMTKNRKFLAANAVLAISVSVAAITVVNNAFAGSFALREQSTYSQGASFAGNATCGDSI